MIAEITFNEQWLAAPAVLAGLALIAYSVWPATVAKQLSQVAGLICLGGAVAIWWLGDAPTHVPTPSRPDAPVVVPVNSKLADLVPDEVQGKIGRFYASLASVIEADTNLKTTDQLHAAYLNCGPLMKRACGLPDGLAGFVAATNELLKGSMSLNSQPLTPELRGKFVTTCRGIAAELGVTP